VFQHAECRATTGRPRFVRGPKWPHPEIRKIQQPFLLPRKDGDEGRGLASVFLGLKGRIAH
jgi:hypothetical protein